MMWLEVCATNNDPAVITGYYIACVQQLHGFPKNLRTDPGTENSTAAAIQSMLSNDAASHKFVTSVRNQRIEAWWSYFRRNKAQWWMDYFSDLCSSGVYDPDNRFQRYCFQFCFMKVLQKELDNIAVSWNSHRIRPNTGSCPAGIPNEIYFLYETYSKSDFKQPVTDDIIDDLRTHTKDKKVCDDSNVYEYLDFISTYANWEEPTDVNAALQRYIDMMQQSGEN